MAQYGGTGGKWYTISPNQMDFSNAASYCTGLGLTLATVTIGDDLDNVISFMRKLPRHTAVELLSMASIFFLQWIKTSWEHRGST